MNMSQQHDPEDSATDESFAKIVAEMGDLAPVDGDDGFEAVRIELPDPAGRRRPVVLTLETSSDIVQLIRAELSPQRIVAMVCVMQGLSELADPPDR